MAVITKRAFFRHYQAGPTSHVRHIKNGKVANDGVGASFWFRPLGSAVSELPIEEIERPMLFRARTSDHQEVSVQATLSYRIEDPELAATRVDFSVDLSVGHWSQTPLEQLGGILTEMAQQPAMAILASMTLADVMVTGIADLRRVITVGLSAEPWLADAGVRVVGVRVIALRPEADIEKALQNPIREALQQEADKATYERRARAVEQERAIGENELQNQIALARREEELVNQHGANNRLRATEEAEAKRIAIAGDAHNVEVTAFARAEHTRLVGAAEAEAETARMAAYSNIGEQMVLALAVLEMAGNLPDIDTLVLTPELITPLLAKLGAGGAPPIAGAETAPNASVEC